MNVRRRAIAVAVPLLLVATLLGSASAAENNVCGSPPPNGPVVREVTVNQGVGAYGPLAWNKRTVVRAYLTKDLCHDLDTVELRSAVLAYTLIVGGQAVSHGEIQPTAPVAGLTLGDYGDGIVGGTAAHDPIFLIDGVPGTLVAPDDPFELRLELRIGYRGVVGTEVTEGTKIHHSARAFGLKQNALRIILVPLVAGGHAVDQASVTSDLYTMSRIAPLASGLQAGLDPGGPGLRYAWHPELDITAYLDGADGTFCGDEGYEAVGSDPVLKALADIRLSYNRLNGTSIDRVIGVVAPGLLPADTACPAGMAEPKTSVAWSRAHAGSAHRWSGSVMTHELSHTVGLAHTSSTSAELDDRAFDSITGAAIDQDRPLMNYRTTSDWHDGATLLEPGQWEQVVCRLTPGYSPAEHCGDSLAGLVGTALAKVGQHFTLVGFTDGTPAGTIASSQEAEHDASTDVDDDSEYRLVQRDAEGNIRGDPVGVPVTATHVHRTDGTEAHRDQLHFGIVVPTTDATAAYELWRGIPDTTEGVLLHRRLRNAAPAISSAELVPVGGDARNVTADELDEDDPALSSDGSLLAFSIDGALSVQPTDDRTARTGHLVGTHPAWSADGRLAYLQDGDVRVVTVTVADGMPRLDDDRLLYASTDLFGNRMPASSPTWSPDGKEVAVIVDGQIRALTADPAFPHTSSCAGVAGCRVLQQPDEVGRIAWSGDDLMAFDDGTNIWVFDVGRGTEPDLFLEQSTHPRWGGSWLVSLDEGDGIRLSTVVRDASGAPTLTASAELVTSAFVTSPAVSGDGSRAGWIETLSDSTAGTRNDDVMVLDTDRRRLIVDATDDDLATLEGAVHLACGGDSPIVHPLLVALRPVLHAGGARFTADIDGDRLCHGGALSFQLDDGVQLDTRDVGTAGHAAAPTVGIHEPAADGGLTRFASLPLAGAAFDRDGDHVDLAWILHRPDGTETVLSTDPFPPAVPAPSGGWDVGAHTIVLRGTDTSGAITAASRTFDVFEDADGDGIAAHLETASCLGEDADHDPSTPHGDPDRDGIPTAADDDPCTSAVDVVADFEPDMLYVPSTGSTVAVRLPLGSRVTDGSVAMSRIGGFPVGQGALSVSTERDGTVVAKFDRQWLTAFLTERGLVGTYVPIVVTGLRADGSGFRALDPASPVTSPG